MKNAFLVSVLTLISLFAAHAQQTQKSANQQNAAAKSDSASSIKKTSAKNSLKTTYVRPDSKQRFNRYVNSIVGPVSLAKYAFSSGLNTWTNSPEEWGGSWEGFGRRFASNAGKSAIKNTTIYALDESLKLDSRFYRSEKRGAGSKIKNALISPFTARNENGERVFGLPRLVGTYTSSIVAAETWYPERFNYKNGLRSGTISLGTTAAINLVKEFLFKKKD